MNGMAMPGGPATGAWGIIFGAGAFVAGWTCMMAVMMLPSLAPTLRQYHRMVARSRDARPGRLTTVAVAAYLAVWCAVGALVFATQIATAGVRGSLAPRATAVVVAAVVLAAAAVQFTSWKSRHLACCRDARLLRGSRTVGARAAWRFGVRLGWHCLNSSAALMLALLAVGMMDLRAMAAVTGAIAAERLMPARARVAWLVGGIGGAYGLVLLVQLAGR